MKDYMELRPMSDEFYTLIMLPDETYKLYIDRVKLAAEELATAGRTLDSEEVVYRLLLNFLMIIVLYASLFYHLGQI